MQREREIVIPSLTRSSWASSTFWGVISHNPNNSIFNVAFEVLTAVVMKSSVFWDIMPCSQALFSSWFLARLILRPWRWRRYVTPKRQLTFSGLHGVVSQKNSTLQFYLLSFYKCVVPVFPAFIHPIHPCWLNSPLCVNEIHTKSAVRNTVGQSWWRFAVCVNT
jgi:hypothetical protein